MAMMDPGGSKDKKKAEMRFRRDQIEKDSQIKVRLNICVENRAVNKHILP
jgi:hypothetical protein